MLGPELSPMIVAFSQQRPCVGNARARRQHVPADGIHVDLRKVMMMRIDLAGAHLEIPMLARSGPLFGTRRIVYSIRATNCTTVKFSDISSAIPFALKCLEYSHHEIAG